MNERIQELAKQAMWSKTDYSQENELYSFSRDELEKFAFLIVQECARIAIQKQTENDVNNIVSENPAKDFAYAMIEHFGIGK